MAISIDDVIIVDGLVCGFDGSFVILPQSRLLPFDPAIQFIVLHRGLNKLLLPPIEHPLQLVFPKLRLRGQV